MKEWVKILIGLRSHFWCCFIKWLGRRPTAKSIAGHLVQTAKQYELEYDVEYALRQLSTRKILMDSTDDNLNRAMAELEILRDENRESKVRIASIHAELKAAKRDRERLFFFSYILRLIAEYSTISQTLHDTIRTAIYEIPDNTIDAMTTGETENLRVGLQMFFTKLKDIIEADSRQKATAQLLANARQQGEGMISGVDNKKDDGLN